MLMKKFFTIVSGCLSGVIMAFSGVCGAFCANAEEYKSMIRYDRVWECLNLEGVGLYKQLYIKCMRFDGVEEINGKTYHRIVTFRKSTKLGEAYDIQDDVFEHEGFLREDNGVVYTLIDEYGERYIPSMEAPVQNTDDLTEVILYDFNRKVGEEYEGWTSILFDADKCLFRVISESTIDIDGETCRSIEIASIDPYEGNLMPSHTFIEGIGASEYGCLNYHEYSAMRTGMWCRNSINRVFDMDGNVIFKCLDGCQYEDLQYGPFSATNGVVSIPGHTDTDAPLYDILGRRIANPAPGHLYIQRGKKHIAR